MFRTAKQLLFIQGLMTPYTTPKIERIEASSCARLLQILSPALVYTDMSKVRDVSDDLAVNSNEINCLLQVKLGAALSLYSGHGDPMTQSTLTSYTLSRFIKSVENNRFDDAYSAVNQSESVEIWRSLASLCIKNGYTDLLKTCVSHLKSPVVSLLLRSSNNTAKKQN